MNSNPAVIIDSEVIDIWSRVIVHLWRVVKMALCVYRTVEIENTIADETIKSLATVLHEKHALNKTGFCDVQGVLGWFSADSSSRHCCTR